MTDANILARITAAISKKEAVQLAGLYADKAGDLTGISLSGPPEVGFRAAWILELIYEGFPEKLDQDIPAILDAYHRQQNPGAMRHFTKIMMAATDTTDKVGKLSESDIEHLVSTTFDWMINPSTSVAVQVNCMDILFNLRSRADWIQDELEEQINFLLKDGSPALQSRGKRVLKKISKAKK